MMKANLVWSTERGDDLIAYMARVSNPDNQGNVNTAPRLIRYLIREQHWSPFEMVNACIEVECPRDIARQLLRHKSLHVQEFSQRYQDVRELQYPDLRECRMQDLKNRQNSLPCDSEELKSWWEGAQQHARLATEVLYEAALERGIAKEVARAVLPEGLTPTRLYVNGTLRSWIHFCKVRLDSSAQKEIRVLAEEISWILGQAFPNTWEAAFKED